MPDREALRQQYVLCDICGNIVRLDLIKRLEVLIENKFTFLRLCPVCWRREDQPEKYIKKITKSEEGIGGVSPKTLKETITDLVLILTEPQKISFKGKEVPEIRDLIIAKLVKSIKIAEKMVKKDPEKYLRVLGYLAQVLNSACDSKLKIDSLAERVKVLEEMVLEEKDKGEEG